MKYTLSSILISSLPIAISHRVPLTREVKIETQEMPSPDHLVLQATPTFDVFDELVETYYENFYGSILIGPNQTEVTVSFDTEGTALFVKSDTCGQCAFRQYPTWSDEIDSFTDTGVSSVGYFNFGTRLSGTILTGDVCLGQDSCLTDMEVVRVTSLRVSVLDSWFSASVYQYGGVLGLAPTSPIIQEMHDQLSLGGTDPIFTMYLSDLSGSFLDFGEVDTSLLATGNASDDIAWLDNTSSDLSVWQSKIRGVMFKGGEFFSEDLQFAFTERVASTYTGGQCIQGPQDEINFLRQALSDALVHFEVQTSYLYQYLFKCSKQNLSQLPSFYLLIGDHWIEVLPEHYVMQVSSSRCTFCLYSGSATANEWRLGTTFLKEWLVIHNTGQDKFGFATHVDSTQRLQGALYQGGEELSQSYIEYGGELKVLNQAPATWVVAVLIAAAGVSFLSTAFFLSFVISYRCRGSTKLVRESQERQEIELEKRLLGQEPALILI